MSELPELLQRAKGEDSIDAIAARAVEAGHKLSRDTVAKYLRGDRGRRTPPDATLQALAAGFNLDVRALRDAVGRQSGELGPWIPDARAAALTQSQRDALNRLIVAIVEQGRD